MRSLRKFFQIQLLFASLIITVIFFTILGLDFVIGSQRKFIAETTIIFGGLNNIFTRGTVDEPILELLDTYFPENTLRQHKASGDLIALEAEGRRVIRELQELRSRRVDILNSKVHTALYLLAPLVILLLTLFITANARVKELHTTSKNIVLYFDRLLSSPPINQQQLQQNEHVTKIQELEGMNNFMKRTVDTIRCLRELQSMDTCLSLESFVDQFGAILCSDKYQHILPCERFSLAVFSSAKNTLTAFHAIVRGNRPITLKRGFVQPFAETSLSAILEAGLPYRIINNLEERKGLSAQLLVEEGIRANITVPVMVNQRLFGFIFFAHSQKRIYTDEIGQLAARVVNVIQTYVYYSYAIQKTLTVFSEGMVNTVEFKDNETADHTRRVSLYSELIAEVLQEQGMITPQKASEIREYAPLHDIGKVGVPDEILLKPAKLTPQEWIIMQQHPVIGGKLIKSGNTKLIEQIGYGILHTAYNIVIDHHERWDGTGYPQRKKGMDISIEGQIVAIADVFDALTTKRPYKKAIPIDESFSILQKEAGTHFNPELVEIFISNRDLVIDIYNSNYVISGKGGY